MIESLMRKFEEEEKEAAAACQEDEKDVTEEEDATQGEEETVVSDSTETEAIPIENTDDVDKSEPVSASTRGPERKTAVHVESVETRGACQEEEEDEHEDKDATEVEIKNIVSDSTETETIPMKNTDVVEKSEPVPAAKRGRKRKNDVSVAPVKTRGRKDKKACQEEEEDENDEKDATQVDEENVVSGPTETEAIPTECTDDVDKSEPVLAAKRGRKRKNAATALVAPAKTSGRKAKKACGEKEEDEHEDKDAAQEGEEILVSDSTETKVVPIENTDDVEESEPVPAAKRGHKRENAALASAPVAPARTRGRKAKEAVDDGNDSPSCPLHVPADN